MTSVTYGHGHLDDFSTFWSSTTGTADAGGDTTHTVDAERTEAEDYWNGYYIKYTSGDNAGLNRLITDFVAATDTITHLAFPNGVSAGDTYVLSAWTQYLNNMVAADAVPTISNGDWLEIKAVFDEAATDEYVYYEKDISNISSDTYTRFLLRWKTSASSLGAKAKVILVFTSGSQTILDGSYSTSWQVTSGDITSGKTIDKIQVYADDDGTDGTFYVYYHFVLLHKDTFTLPNVAYGSDFNPSPRYAIVPIFGRVGDIIWVRF